MDRHEFEAELRRQLRERPYWTLGIALGVGWVLGRTLPPRMLVAVAGLGARTALASALEGAVVDTLQPFVARKEKQNGNGSHRHA